MQPVCQATICLSLQLQPLWCPPLRSRCHSRSHSKSHFWRQDVNGQCHCRGHCRCYCWTGFHCRCRYCCRCCSRRHCHCYFRSLPLCRSRSSHCQPPDHRPPNPSHQALRLGKCSDALPDSGGHGPIGRGDRRDTEALGPHSHDAHQGWAMGWGEWARCVRPTGTPKWTTEVANGAGDVAVRQ